MTLNELCNTYVSMARDCNHLYLRARKLGLGRRQGHLADRDFYLYCARMWAGSK
jgi:hypothetical protein